MKKADLQKVIQSIKVQDLNGKVLMLDEQYFTMQDAQNLQEGLKDSGLAAMVILPTNAKYDIKTKDELKKMVNAL